MPEPKIERCPNCKGVGLIHRPWMRKAVVCPRCDGTGQVLPRQPFRKRGEAGR